MNKNIASIYAHSLHLITRTKKKHWVFGSDYGNMYREGSKYLFEYINKNHPDIKCTFIVQKSELVEEIRKKGYRAELNYSRKGVEAISHADAIFTTQWVFDVKYAFLKKNRKFYYLVHGQSLKKQMKALSNDFEQKIITENNNTLFSRIKGKLLKALGQHFSIDDVSFVSANSEYFIPFFKKSYGTQMQIKVLGMPRNDALFMHEEIEKERWMDDLKGKFVITYMPTHRKYGKGELPPIPFNKRPDILNWMRENKIILLMKQHPNMIKKDSEPINNDVIRDITKMGFDPQVVIYYSDVLISDYSSVWLDYLLLRRPLITYIYDNFEENDAGLNIDIINETPGHLAFNEDELFNIIKRIIKDYDSMKPSEESIRKFYKDPDGHSSERYFKAIISDLY